MNSHHKFKNNYFLTNDLALARRAAETTPGGNRLGTTLLFLGFMDELLGVDTVDEEEEAEDSPQTLTGKSTSTLLELFGRNLSLGHRR